MSVQYTILQKDRESILKKFDLLVTKAKLLADHNGLFDKDNTSIWFELRTSALNLLERTAGPNSIYFRELYNSPTPRDSKFMTVDMLGILRAAQNDYIEGFMIDSKLLVSAEIFADFLEQAEALIASDYKDAAAVIIRAVLEDGLRRVSVSRGIELKPRWGIDDIAKEMAKCNVITAIQKKEIDAKREVGNHAAHGRFNEYSKEDVIAFHEFVQRLLAAMI
jgi:hypothetical protein